MKVEIPENIFLKNPVTKETIVQKMTGNEIGVPIRIEYPPEGGIYGYYDHLKYPIKGVPFYQALEMANVAKKMIMSAVFLLTRTPLKYFMPFWFILPGFIRKKVFYEGLYGFIAISEQALGRWFLEPMRYCDAVRAFYFGANHFITQQCSSEKTSSSWTAQSEADLWRRFLMIMCMVFEFDNAYRFRAQDILGELNIDNLNKKPLRELWRLAKLATWRERTGGIGSKWKAFAVPVIIILFFNRRLKKKMIMLFTNYIQLDRIKLDDNDWYHVCGKTDYDYKNVGLPQRVGFRRKEDLEWQQQKGQTNNNQNAKVSI